MTVLDPPGLPVGADLQGWTPRELPPRRVLRGHYARLEPLSAANHVVSLHEAFSRKPADSNWTYLPYGPFASEEAFAAWVEGVEPLEDPHFYAVVDERSGQAGGVASYLRMQPEVGVIEVGHLNFSPRLQRTIAATEAMYLMMRQVFDDLGYRRYEWKCDSLNAASMTAARRLGFRYEGIFRQATVYKGRNRDTAWFSIIDSEWPDLRDAFEIWLAPENFTRTGTQRRGLAEIASEGDRGVGRGVED